MCPPVIFSLIVSPPCLNSLPFRLIIITVNSHAHLLPGEGLRNEIAKRRRAGMDGDAVEEEEEEKEEEESYEEGGRDCRSASAIEPRLFLSERDFSLTR